jgi:trimeric autotransporter adhesin
VHSKLPSYLIALLVAVGPLTASEYHGVVQFGGLPVPGATVTATQGDQKSAAVTDRQGAFSFPDLRDGAWTIDIGMPGFAPIHQDVNVIPAGQASEWELKILPFTEIMKDVPSPAAPVPEQAAASTPTTPAEKTPSTSRRASRAPAPQPSGGFQRADVNASAPAAPAAAASSAADAIPPNDNDLAQRASDGLLINGTANNGAASPFAQSNAFGNNRRGTGGVYNGSLGLTFDNSTLDARSFSLTGQDTPKPAYDHVTGLFTLGGPLRIPHLLRNGPVFFIGYQWTRNRSDSTQSALVPTLAQRSGDVGGGIIIPQSAISPQALSLLNYYPLPNFTGSPVYNFQIPLVSNTHQDAMQSRLSKGLGQRTQIDGSFNFQRIATSNTNLFGFLDTGHTLGLNAVVKLRRRIGSRLFAHAQFQYSYQSVRTTPYFANRENVSGDAGITGNDQSPANWGPPTLSFSSGVTSLSDAINSFNRNQTAAWSNDNLWNHGRHNIAFGGDFRRQQFNYLVEQNPRGTFTFTGADTGSAFGDFLIGVPDTSQIAFGNADKYFRENVWDAFVNDDWRIGPSLTVNVGVRWEYGAPINELYGRLVNLAIAPGFSAATPVVGNSLLQPDRHGIEPRLGLAWRPFAASSTVVRAGYGIYYNTSVYQAIALQMAQQAPLSRSLSVPNSPADLLTLASGFNVSPTITQQSFAVDPNFRMGYTQNWQASIQRDLPGSLVATATYLGIKGTRGMQEFLPNTYPIGAVNPCPTCPSGFTYLTSNGNSTRESGSLQLRRRLHNGFTASLQYTYSKSIDDAALGGRVQPTYVVAQNWLDLSAERGLSTFDQRQLLNLQMQYTTGMGLGGGTLLNGWRGRLLKEWTVLTTITAGTGLPQTPVYLAAVGGTGITGPIRPDYNGGPDLSPTAYSAPLPGQWGTAGRDSITGPSQFTLNASLDRIFRLRDRLNLEVRFDSTNALNHVTWTTWNTIIGNPQFGFPAAANAMRDITTTMRLRF